MPVTPWTRAVAAGTLALFFLTLTTGVVARQSEPAPSRPDGTIMLVASDDAIRVVTVARGLAHPWSLAFLPDGDVLVTEREGRLRIVRQGVLDPEPVAGIPDVHANLHGGLLDVALHPLFAENRLVYFTYTPAGENGATVALARGRFDGTTLQDVETIFVADAWSTTDVQYGSRIVFGSDGTIFMSVGERNERERAQSLADHAGTIVRLRDDGSVPDDNPFVGHDGERPEIYTYGHRNVQGLAVDPTTGSIWATEHGPQGGDEVNVLTPGANYGWPLTSLGREYTGEPIGSFTHEDTELPLIYWTPSIGISGMTFYTGQRFSKWMGNLFVAALAGRQAQRVLLTDAGPYGRESLLSELRYRIRDVRQGPDELLYVLTDDDDGLVLRIEPDDDAPGSAS